MSSNVVSKGEVDKLGWVDFAITITFIAAIVLGIWVAWWRTSNVSDASSGWSKVGLTVMSRSNKAIEPGSNLTRAEVIYTAPDDSAWIEDVEIPWDSPENLSGWIKNGSNVRIDNPPQPFALYEVVGLYILGPGLFVILFFFVIMMPIFAWEDRRKAKKYAISV